MTSPESRVWSGRGLVAGPAFAKNAATKSVRPPRLSIQTPTIVDGQAADVPAVECRGFQVLVFNGPADDQDARQGGLLDRQVLPNLRLQLVERRGPGRHGPESIVGLGEPGRRGFGNRRRVQEDIELNLAV